MDIAVSLALAVAGQTLPAWRARRANAQGAAYPLQGGRELWSVSLRHSADKVAQVSAVQPQPNAWSLSLSGASVSSPAVSLTASGGRRWRRALKRVCRGWEFSLSRPRAWVASGVLAFALFVLAGGQPAQARSTDCASLPCSVNRAVQCESVASSPEALLATIEQPAQHRVFTRTGVEGETSDPFIVHTNIPPKPLGQEIVDVTATYDASNNVVVLNIKEPEKNKDGTAYITQVNQWFDYCFTQDVGYTGTEDKRNFHVHYHVNTVDPSSDEWGEILIKERDASSRGTDSKIYYFEKV